MVSRVRSSNLAFFLLIKVTEVFQSRRSSNQFLEPPSCLLYIFSGTVQWCWSTSGRFCGPAAVQRRRPTSGSGWCRLSVDRPGSAAAPGPSTRLWKCSPGSRLGKCAVVWPLHSHRSLCFDVVLFTNGSARILLCPLLLFSTFYSDM